MPNIADIVDIPKHSRHSGHGTLTSLSCESQVVMWDAKHSRQPLILGYGVLCTLLLAALVPSIQTTVSFQKENLLLVIERKFSAHVGVRSHVGRFDSELVLSITNESEYQLILRPALSVQQLIKSGEFQNLNLTPYLQPNRHTNLYFAMLFLGIQCKRQKL